MSVDSADVARLHRLAGQVHDSGDFAQLDTLHEVIACMVAFAITEGLDALNAVELLVTAAKPPRASLRASARVLRRLGYVDVAALMRELAQHAPRARPRKARRSAPNLRQRD